MFRIITIPFSLKDEGFSDKVLNDFILNKKGVQYKAESDLLRNLQPACKIRVNVKRE